MTTSDNRDSSDSRMGEALRWVIESQADPARAAADWLTRDICDGYRDAVAMLTDPEVSLEHLRQAKNAFKTMRVVGETAADRHLAARLYAGAIAAALVRHGTRISSQSDQTVLRALADLEADTDLPEALRSIAGLGRCVLQHLRREELPLRNESIA